MQTQVSLASLRVVIADDSLLMIAGLESLLARFGHTVVASVHDADSLIEATLASRPDLVITDVRMPPGNADDGLRAAVAIRSQLPGQPVLVLSQYVEQSYASTLIESRAGKAVGYLLKDRIGDVEDFARAAENVAGGGTVLDPDVVRQLIRRRHDPLQGLSPREREVLTLMAEGRSNGAIAETLVVTEAAIHKHVGNIFSKLGLPVAANDHRRVLAVLAFLRK